MYKVTLVQNLKYTETIVGFFGNIVEAQLFQKYVLQSFENCSVTIAPCEKEEAKKKEDK